MFLNSNILGFQNLFPCQASDLVVKDSENEAVWNSWVGWVGYGAGFKQGVGTGA